MILIWTSLCMLFEVGPIYLHYMTDRQERFDPKISKLKILWKQRHLGGKLKHIKVNYPFNCILFTHCIITYLLHNIMSSYQCNKVY